MFFYLMGKWAMLLLSQSHIEETRRDPDLYIKGRQMHYLSQLCNKGTEFLLDKMRDHHMALALLPGQLYQTPIQGPLPSFSSSRLISPSSFLMASLLKLLVASYHLTLSNGYLGFDITLFSKLSKVVLRIIKKQKIKMSQNSKYLYDLHDVI